MCEREFCNAFVPIVNDGNKYKRNKRKKLQNQRRSKQFPIVNDGNEKVKKISIVN